MRRLLTFLAPVALVLAACAGGDTTATTTTTTTTTSSSTTTTIRPATTTTMSPSAELDAACTSPDGFAVSYPGDWETNDGEMVAACTMFDPNSFTVPDGTDERVAAITLDLENLPYSTLNDTIDSDRVLSRDPVTVDGREAVRFEYRADGDGIVPDGTLITSYHIDLESEEGSLVANTIDYSTIDYERATRVLDRMVASLDLDVPVTRRARPIGEFTSPPIESPGYPASGDPAWLTDVRFGAHQGFDRVVFEFDEAANLSYSVEYVEEAVPASGNPMDVVGEAILGVMMRPASGVDHTEGELRETYRGPERVNASGAEVTDLVQV